MGRNPFRDSAIAAVPYLTDSRLAAFALLEWSDIPTAAAGPLEAYMFAEDKAAALGPVGLAAVKVTLIRRILAHAHGWTGAAADKIKLELLRRYERALDALPVSEIEKLPEVDE